ncbi:MAG: AAA family ATPase [Actinomycetia bacterium]|nr:AAA family ATPase [Actinomycetes bacterium]
MTQKLRALFGLKWNPFSPNVPAEALWRSPQIEHFCWRIEELVREGGFALITGDPATGKSVALRILAHHPEPHPADLDAVLTRPQSSLGDLYHELGDLFGITLAPHNRWTGVKTLRQTWLTHVEATRYRPILLVDEAQEMLPSVLAELRILASTDFDSRAILTVVLCGDQRLTQHLRRDDLLPVASRLRVRLPLDYLPPKELLEWLRHVLEQAGQPQLMTPEVMTTLTEHAAGNLRVLATMANELLAMAARRELTQIDQKLYFEIFANQHNRRPAGPARQQAGIK